MSDRLTDSRALAVHVIHLFIVVCGVSSIWVSAVDVYPVILLSLLLLLWILFFYVCGRLFPSLLDNDL